MIVDNVVSLPRLVTLSLKATKSLATTLLFQASIELKSLLVYVQDTFADDLYEVCAR